MLACGVGCGGRVWQVARCRCSGAGFPKAGGVFRLVGSGPGVQVLGEGGADAGPGGGDRGCPAPGGVDAQPKLSGAAGDAGGNVQDP